MEKPSDSDLLALIRENNEKAFAAIVHRYRKELYRQIYRKSGCEETTKDILQEIYISLWKNRDTIQIEDSFLPYLSKAAHYRVVDFYLQEKKKGIVRQLNSDEDYPSQGSADLDLEAAELEARFASGLRKLQPNIQYAFTLSRREGLSVRQIAEKMALSEQTVKNYITLAVQALQEILKKEHSVLCVLFGVLIG